MGRMIGPKTWDRIMEFFFRLFGLSVTIQKPIGLVVLEIKH